MMTDDELKALKKEASTKKRIAMEWASQIHDLVEDRLFEDYNALPDLASSAVAACEEWAAAQAKYDAAGG
jgi:hypothetical protein